MPNWKGILGQALQGVALAGSIFPIPEWVNLTARRGGELLTGAAKADANVARWFARLGDEIGIPAESLRAEERAALEAAVRDTFRADAALQTALSAVLVRRLAEDDAPAA